VTSNVAPRLCSEFQSACLAGNYRAALDIHDRLMPLHTSLFLENSPAPTKYALGALGRMAEDVRLPLAPCGDATRGAVRAAMVHAGLLNG
jgi:4-hydroxy-tetrahydrodipicolinate synthase